MTLSLNMNFSYAHGGRSDKNGCHFEKKTGKKHCHEKKTEKSNKATLDNSGDVHRLKVSKGSLIEIYNDGFTIWYDCDKHAPVRFRYNAQRDSGKFKRHKKFSLDPSLPKVCSQLSSKPYGKSYDRGHMVPANHLDHSEKALKQSNYMTNILPQYSKMNRGAWLLTEEIIECYRDKEELLILGGVIWGEDKSNDIFLKSHGVETPDYFWKFIIKGLPRGYFLDYS